MLNVYATRWCPHCTRTVEFLTERKIPFRTIDMDRVDPETERRVVEANGGDDWVVPTLEFNGRWRPGAFFNAVELEADLRRMGAIT